MFRSGVHLPENEAESLLDQVISETDDRALVELLNVWKSKGYGESELYGLSKTMRERCVPVRSSHQVFVDAVGTGGSKAKTFNVSTAAAFVIAGAGVPIAKHGNRAATSNSGSADVLAELGVNPAVNAITAERCLEEIGICFMFAPNFHRLSPVLGKVRRDLGFPTIFNNLGPLCNPARAPHQVIGVWDRERLLPTANVLARLGTRHSWIVHGSDGLDEVTLSGPTFVAEIRDGRVKEFEVSPEDFGINARCLEGLKTKSPGESAGQVKAILNGSVDGTAQDLVLINSAAAIYIAGRCETLPDAFMLANESIFSGAALQKLQRLSIATK
jgi:anthranilate phosphoribosyltransferase